jgi:hypothetical protein
MELHFKIIGYLLIILAAVHVIFPSYFKWKEELSSLSLINRQVMKVHTFFIALTVLMMGILCLTSTHDLIHTHLGKNISLGFAVFWSFRLLIQLFGYSYKLWYGKVFETIVHIVFTTLWSYLAIVFWINALLWID